MNESRLRCSRNAALKSRARSYSAPALLCLMMLVSIPARARAKQRYSARQGDLTITATRVEAPETVARDLGRFVQARNGYHFVVVNVEVRNVGRTAQCTYFAPVILHASFGIETHRMIVGGGQEPVTNQLLPGEKTEGSYRFEVKDGVTPLELILSPAGGQGCGAGDLSSEYGLHFGPLKLDLPPPESPDSSRAR